MQTISLTWGILSIAGMIIGFIPCLGSMNWLVIPFAGVGIIIGALALSSSDASNRTSAVAGLTCCAIAVLFGLFRLVIGAGVI